MRTVLMFVGGVIAWLCVSMIALWVVGRVFTDRFYWSQWLFWIPTPALLPAIVLGLLSSLRPQRKPGLRRNRLIRWSACGVALLVYFAVIEHRFIGPPLDPKFPLARNTPGQLRLVHWNAQDPPAKPEAVLDRLRELDGDVMFLTDINWSLWVPLMETDPLKTGITPVHFGASVLISRLPILSVRPLVATRDLLWIMVVEIDATSLIGRTLTIYFVDMPSDPRIARADLMRRARTLLEQATAPNPPPVADVVVGDFNIPRGSASISLLFPGMREAFNEAGHGYGATYHRSFPLYHIDHILLAPSLRCLRYDLVDPRMGRHRAQIAWISSSSG